VKPPLPLIGVDTFGNYVYKREEPALVRYSDYHPEYSTEAYFYNVLLEQVGLSCKSGGVVS
jgi:hypothetical protein